MTQIEEQAFQVLAAIVEANVHPASPESLSEATELPPENVNDAVEYLEDIGGLEVLRELGNPFFVEVMETGRTKFLYQQMKDSASSRDGTSGQVSFERPINPVGSPYGFNDEDWESISASRSNKQELGVVVGLQFESTQYDTDQLINNLRTHFDAAVARYNESHPDYPIGLRFVQLQAGYGEHQFNLIARDIIGSDIAIFDTSDHNPNVMIELGVALTWGVKVLPIREMNSPTSPSDISGQTWLKYVTSGEQMLDEGFEDKLQLMIENAILKKGRQ